MAWAGQRGLEAGHQTLRLPDSPRRGLRVRERRRETEWRLGHAGRPIIPQA
jgi:hypothetical protein